MEIFISSVHKEAYEAQDANTQTSRFNLAPAGEQQAIFKVIDLAISNKKLKDNLSSLIAQ